MPRHDLLVVVSDGREWRGTVRAPDARAAGRTLSLRRAGFDLPLRGASIRVYVNGRERRMDDRRRRA